MLLIRVMDYLAIVSAAAIVVIAILVGGDDP